MRSTRILTGLDAVTRPPARAVVTVGVFDGVHLAHQRLIQATVQAARRARGTSVVVTFHPDPHTVLDPSHAQPLLMPLAARLARLQQLGVDWIWIIPFTKRFARLTAAQFIRRILIGRLRASMLVVGEAFVFGRNRQGNMDALRAIGPTHGMRVVALRQVQCCGQSISSSRIRRLIARGRFAHAARLLGRAPELYGLVVRGAGRGRTLGTPTANIALSSRVLPPEGVYAVMVNPPSPDAQFFGGKRGEARVLLRSRADKATAKQNTASERLRPTGKPVGLHTSAPPRAWQGVMNFGMRPTFGPGPRVCEVHLLGFSGTLLGRPVRVSLLARLRGERRFSSIEALTAQIRRDLARARRVFARSTSQFRSP